MGFLCHTGTEWGLLFAAELGFLTVVASLTMEHRPWGTWASVAVVPWAPEHRLNSRGARAWSFRGMWDLPRPGIKPVSQVLTGGFFTTEPPGGP